jgi:hypothetical protein
LQVAVVALAHQIRAFPQVVAQQVDLELQLVLLLHLRQTTH